MPKQLASPTLDALLKKGSAAATAVAAEVRRRLRKLAGQGLPTPELLRRARVILARHDRLLARALGDTLLAAWVEGAAGVADALPAREPVPGLPPAKPPRRPLAAGAQDLPPPVVRYPATEAAARDLLERRVLTRGQFDTLASDARRAAFTVSRVASLDALQAVQQAVAESVAKGQTLAEFRERVEDALGESALSPAHVENVFRTNVMQAHTAGLLEVLRDPLVSEEFPYLQYVAVHDARARPEHLEMERRGIGRSNIYRRDDPIWQTFMPPWDFNCFLPGTVVQGEFELGLRSWYAGQVVEITTRGGQRLTVTANHPVLTPEGFTPAHALCQGDDVLCYQSGGEHGQRADRADKPPLVSRPDEAGLAPPLEDEQHAPAFIEDVFGALMNVSHTVRMPVLPHDLHGDAVRGDGYVDVVGAGVQLLRDLQSHGAERFSHLGLTRVNEALAEVARLRHRDPLTERLLSPAAGVPGGGTLPDDGRAVLLQPGPLHSLRFGPAADLDASLHECPGEGAARAARLALQLQERHPGLVARDQIVEVRQRQFAGHVYDLQSKGGWIVANSIFCSNCRCGVIPLTIEDAAARGVTEAVKWERTGVPPARPTWVEPPPFGPSPGWTRRRLEAIV